MPDDREIIYVPVDPKAYGVGLGLGCLIRFWKEILGAMVLMFVVGMAYVGISQAVDKAENAQDQRTAAKTAVVVNTQAAVQADQLTNGFARSAEIYVARQAIAVNQRQDLGNERYIQVNWLVFAPDGLRVYLEARHNENWPGNPGDSCLVWAGSNNFEGVEVWRWYNSPYITEGLYVNPTFVSMERLEPPPNTEGGAAFYQGYMVFPYEVFPPSADYLRAPGYYLSYACKVDSGQIPLLVMTDYQSWVVMDRLDYYPGGVQAREQAEQANSFMVLESLEHEADSADVQVKLGILLDAETRDFTTSTPDEVYLEAGGQRFPATAWGGLFSGNERIAGFSWGLYGDSYPGPGWVRFAGAWEALRQADCFNLHFGQSYQFNNVCLSMLTDQGR